MMSAFAERSTGDLVYMRSHRQKGYYYIIDGAYALETATVMYAVLHAGDDDRDAVPNTGYSSNIYVVPSDFLDQPPKYLIGTVLAITTCAGFEMKTRITEAWWSDEHNDFMYRIDDEDGTEIRESKLLRGSRVVK